MVGNNVLNVDLSKRSQSQSDNKSHRHFVVAWVILVAVLFPAREMSINVGVNLTPGRVAVILLFFPALLKALRSNHRIMVADCFTLATVSWIVIATVTTKGIESLLTAAGGECLEFLGGYLIGRAYLWYPNTLKSFLTALKFVTIVLVLFALADRISGQQIIENTIASIVHVVPAGGNYRNGVIRATATLDHPILLGAFFAFASALFIYSRDSAMGRAVFLLLTFFGCFLAQSSASLMAWVITVCAYFYDVWLGSVRTRWGIFWAVTGISVAIIFVVANAPIGWIITHLTLDPESGYFRYLIWTAAFDKIAESPLMGYAFNSLDDVILDTTVDSVWLVYALRFGIPTIVFLFLATVSGIWPIRKSRDDLPGTVLMSRMSMGFTVMLLMIMFIGVTVHFWNYMWIFWGLCLGAKVSLKEQLALTKPAATYAYASARGRLASEAQY